MLQEPQPDFQDSQLPTATRRRGDPCEVGSDIWRSVAAIEARVSIVERTQDAVKTSFPQNDLSQPDFDGHRRAHIEQIETAKMLKGYKATATSKIIGWVVTFLLGALAAGFIDLIRRGA